MTPFTYHKPGTVAEVVALLRSAPNAKPIAGGMTLLPTIKQRLASPTAVIDLSALPDIKGITAGSGTLTIGAMTRHIDVANSATVKESIPALAALAISIGDPAVRNRGTIGGSLANNDPSADYPAAALALDATIVTDTLKIPADSFFAGLFETALKPDEIILAVEFKKPVLAGYAKFRSPASRYALIGVFVAQYASGVRVAVTGAGSGVFRLPAFEAALASRFEPSAVDGLPVDTSGVTADMHADADFRAHLIEVMAKRAVAAAQDPARAQ